jgi:DNA-binding transcriptional LysR family regulator
MTTVDLNRIAAFVRVVEAGSFTAAARVLGVPVSSVSRAVSNLETELGARLLHRTTRKLNLTDGGQHFFQRMQTVIAEAEEATQAVTGFAADPRGVVRITVAPGLGGRHLPGIVGRILGRYPGVVIELKVTNRVLDLIGEGIDLAIRGGMLTDSSLVARKVAVSELAVFASPAYLERRGRPRRPADLARHDCLSYGGRDGKLPWRLTGPNGEQTVTVSGPIVCDDMIFLREAAIAGLGLAMIPAEVTTDAVEAGQLVRVLPRHSFASGGIYLVWPSQKLVPARVVAVRERLIEELTALYA